MSRCVVDNLEIVEIHEQQGQLGRIFSRPFQRRRQKGGQPLAVGQPGQHVFIGHALQLLFMRLALADVLQRDRQADAGAHQAAVGPADLDPVVDRHPHFVFMESFFHRQGVNRDQFPGVSMADECGEPAADHLLARHAVEAGAALVAVDDCKVDDGAVIVVNRARHVEAVGCALGGNAVGLAQRRPVALVLQPPPGMDDAENRRKQQGKGGGQRLAAPL